MKIPIPTRTITIEAYNPSWADSFSQLANFFREAIGEHLIRVEHVGSTSVVGLAAKSIIDIDLVINRYKSLDTVIARLREHGYAHRGDLGIPGREAFRCLKPSNIPHNLYVCDVDSDELARHLSFRDYLRAHPSAVQEYSALKDRLAAQYPHDIDAYCCAKTDYICDILQRITPDLVADARHNNTPA